jgi:hypothetical protein
MERVGMTFAELSPLRQCTTYVLERPKHASQLPHKGAGSLAYRCSSDARHHDNHRTDGPVKLGQRMSLTGADVAATGRLDRRLPYPPLAVLRYETPRVPGHP